MGLRPAEKVKTWLILKATIPDFELGLYLELDTCDTNPKNLTRALDIRKALGADRLWVYSSYGGDVKEELKQAAEDFRQITPLCADYG